MVAKHTSKAPYTLRDFYLDDLPRTLFPLATNQVLVERGLDRLVSFGEALAAGGGSFLPQRRVYANKDELHLRRTVKLDPVAEIFLYHLAFKNRGRFRKPFVAGRTHFGYRFEDGHPMVPSRIYAEFKARVAEARIFTEEFLYFDVSAYFNNVYHHDLHAWFSALEPEDPNDIVAFGKFLREINAGRSLDCLPQGLYPAKMIGNDFLRFIEASANIRAPQILRFMDDVYLFGNDLNALKADFAEIQRLLGLKGLSVNGKKTLTGGMPLTEKAEDSLGDLKDRLLRRRRHLIVSHYEHDATDEDELEPPLEREEVEFIVSVLGRGELSEDDAELIMIVMRDHADRLAPHLKKFALGFPHLAKNFFGLCGAMQDKGAVAQIVVDALRNESDVSEFQLFWYGKMLDDYLMNTPLAADVIVSLDRHPNATDITRAKLLEIADHRYGLPEMREKYLREGRSDWLAWASAVGSRKMDKQARNYLLDYFKNGSSMNRLIAEIIQSE
ncbi:hypothetical protein FQV39_10430 [Bosea sp. F3-2]|uniref:antiviral reverse transcriptase Drt5 n=1 Tax=Bosea sp. F3-2 TaxID=2599640 RepID=UPI0011ECDD1C|nr:antiviral reverse transcriptase Drt5 [Bosea sp. F3-2]QEL22940.1 hypothetical protein FQV39_10430 [Bosea sp. F3-2]